MGIFSVAILATMATEKSPKNPRPIFSCETCDYHTANKKDFAKHEATRKHLCNISQEKIPAKNVAAFTCSNCKKIYQHRSSYWKHVQQCANYSVVVEVDQKTKMLETIFTPDMITNLISQNKELQNLLVEQNALFMERTSTIIDQNTKLVEQNKQLMELPPKPSTVVTNNNQFNLNIFLNEHCKNAINMADFLNSLKVTVKDLENTGQLGYVDGISRIFVNGLLDMNVCERPVHCTDLKRETVYVRDDNKWNKDDPEKRLMKEAVQKVAQKNLQQIRSWIQEHPDCKDTSSPESDVFVQLSQHATGGGSIQENNRLDEKVVKNVLKTIVLDKTAVSIK